MNENRGHTKDFARIADFAYRNPRDREAVIEYFAAYDRISGHSHDEQVKYYQLKHQYESDPWRYLNMLAGLYLNDNKPSLAYMCLVESLRFNCRQPEIYELSQSVQKISQTEFPKKLQENKYTVSVITCTRGRRIDELKDSIRSVLGQTFQDFELIIINDGGSDDLKSIVAAFESAKIKYYRLEENSGPAKSRNEAILNSEGKYISFLDDDDIYYPNHLRELVKVMDEGQYKVVYSSTKKVNGVTRDGVFKEEKVRGISDQDFNKNILLKYVYVTTCSAMFQREILFEEGLFNGDLLISQDWDFWLKYALKFEFKHIKKVTVEYRKRGDNRTSKNAARARFLGHLVCQYHLYFRGAISFMKYHIHSGETKDSSRLYKEIRDLYPDHFRVPEIFPELIDAAGHFNDKEFLSLLAKDYLKIDAKGCVREIKRCRSLPMFFGIAPKLPLKIWKVVQGAIMRSIENMFRKRKEISANG
ncbi:MAG: glycosyltransferase family 2 protein [Candidatus Omnitrophica bacterium]|nr:glycosyltransferase family 2 protein [Candidatus Omnitrophota bacterium]